MATTNSKQPSRGLKWAAGVATSVLTALVVWWLTSEGPLVNPAFKVSVERSDGEVIIDSSNPRHKVVISIENIGQNAISDFLLTLVIWVSDPLTDTSIDMYGDPNVCRLVDSTEKDFPQEVIYACRTFNPGESIWFSTVYSLESWGCYTPVQVNFFLKASGYTESQILKPASRAYPNWRDECDR